MSDRMTAAEPLDQIEARCEAATAPLPESARMDAYYYGFDRTGLGAIDAVLSAVAVAGKGAHNTDAWGDLMEWGYYSGWPGLHPNPYDEAADTGSAISLIQLTASTRAAEVLASLADLAALTAALRAVLELHRDAGGSQGFFPGDRDYGWRDHCCGTCGSHGEYGVEWPCPTVRAIETALRAER